MGKPERGDFPRFPAKIQLLGARSFYVISLADRATPGIILSKERARQG